MDRLFGGNKVQATRRIDGTWEYLPMSDNFGEVTNYLEKALTNIALFTVLDVQAKMFSRGRFCVLDSEGNELESDPAIDKFSNPNPTQSQQDFLYQHLFFKGLGNNIIREVSRSRTKSPENCISIENLIPTQINYNEINKVSKFIFAKSDIQQEKGKEIKYKLDGKEIKIPLSDLLFFYDVSNGLQADNRYKSPSRVDALIPALANVEEAQKAKNINLKFSAKHLISGKKQAGDDAFMETILDKSERDDISNNVYHKDILVNPNGIEVHNLAVNFNELKYDESLGADLTKIANAYGMSKDVLTWALNGASTHENQKTAIVDWIQNSIQFEADDFTGTWTNHWGYLEQGKRIVLKYDHLPVMQILEDVRMNVMKSKIEVAEGLVRLGMTNENALKEVGL